MRLSDLPEELVSNISLRLGCDDVCSLRLTSRALEAKTLHEFAKEHFTSKAVHFTTESLKPLVHIANSLKFSKYLKEVYVVTALFSKEALKGCPGDGITHWKPTVRQSEAYKFYLDDQQALRKGGGDLALLVEAFSRLGELRKVAVLDSDTLLNPGVDYRGQFKTIRVTGTRPFFTPLSPHDRGVLVDEPEHRQWLSHVWSTLMRAIAASHEILRLEDFRTDFTSARHSIRPIELDLGETTLRQLAKVFRNTTRLQLQIAAMKTDQENKLQREHMPRFAAIFPNVTDLSIAFGSDPHANLHIAPLYRRFISKFTATSLTDLSLRDMCIDGVALCRFITRNLNLKELKLDGLDLTSGDWPPILKAMTKLESLEHLHMMYLREAGNKAYFLKQLEPDEGESLNPDNAFSHMMNDGWDDDDYNDEDDGTDDDLPDLEPANGYDPYVAPSHGPTLPSLGSAIDFSTAPANPPPIVAAPSTARTTTTPAQPSTFNTAADATTDNEPISDYVPNGTAVDYGERGFYICISGHAKIMRELQVFIKEYNLGEALEDEQADLFGGFAGLAGFGPIPLGAGPPGDPGAALANLFNGPMPMGPHFGNLFGGFETFGQPHHDHYHPHPHPHPHSPAHGGAAAAAAAAAPPPGTFGPPLPPHMMNGHTQTNASVAAQNVAPATSQAAAGPPPPAANGASSNGAAADDDDDGWTSDDEEELPGLVDGLGGVLVD